MTALLNGRPITSVFARLDRDRRTLKAVRNRPTLKAIAQFVARIRYAWPGGYALAAVMSDGSLMCSHCVRENYREIAEANRDREKGGHNLTGWETTGWMHTGQFDGPEYCCHCYKEII